MTDSPSPDVLDVLEVLDVPELSDGVVTLRGHRRSDAPAIVEQARDPRSVEFTTVPVPYAPEDADSFLATIAAAWADPAGNRSWAIELADDSGPRFAGTIDYRPREAGLVEIGFGLHPWARGRGAMARAVRLALAYAFEEGGADVAHWLAQVPNWDSRRVAWACGFRVEGAVTSLVGNTRGQRYDGWIASLRKGQPMRPAHPWLVPARIGGDTVVLRPWREDDRPRPDQQPDAASLRFIPPGAQPTATSFDAWLTQQRSRMALGQAVTWCVADAASDEPLGMLSCFHLDNPLTRGSGEVGYWLHESARGRGAMSEAIELLVNHAFTPADHGGLGLHRLAAGTALENTASALILRRAAFSLLGTEHEAMSHVDEAPTDGPLWELLASTERDAVRAAYLPPVVLHGANVQLRPWREDDAPRIVEACSHAGTRQYLRTLPHPYTLEHARAYVRRCVEAQWGGAAVNWCIADATSDVCLGSIALFDLQGINPMAGEIGYWLHPQARDRGVMTEAVRLLADHAFTPRADGGLGLERLALLTAAPNTASLAVARRCGFTEVGRDRQDEILLDGSVVDLVRFDRLKSDG